MTVLILHQFTNHNLLIETLCKNLNRNNLRADSFNISTWELDSGSYKLPISLRILRIILFNYRLKLFVISKFPFVLKGMIREYEIVDIHFFGAFYYNTIDLVTKLKRKIKITIWGSDFYRASDRTKEKQRLYYNKVDMIQIGTSQMKSDFISYYRDFDAKIKLAHFGITQFDTIDEIQYKENINDIKKSLDLPQDKLVVTCGYNGSQGQQHLLILEAIQNLHASSKEDLFLLLPMTYGVSEDALKDIEIELEQLEIPFKILKNNLSRADVCRLRLATDIVVNIQVTDAFSASIQEHLFAQNVVIVGEWLPYDKLQEHQVRYFKASLGSLTAALEDAIINYANYKHQSLDNKEKMRQISSWDIVIKDWIAIYATLD